MLSLKAFLKEIIINVQTTALSDFRVEKIVSKDTIVYKIWPSEKVSQIIVLKEINQEIYLGLLVVSKMKMSSRLKEIKKYLQ